MSLVTTVLLADKYGPRMNLEQMSAALSIPKGTLYQRIALGTLGIPTYQDGKYRFAATEDVAAYLDGLRDQARRAMEAAA